MITLSEILDILIKVEQSCDVNELQCSGYHIWPYLRNLLWIQMRNPNSNVIHPIHGSRPAFAAVPVIQDADKISIEGNKDLFLLSRSLELTESQGNARYDRLVDPIIEFCREDFSMGTFEIIDSPMTNPRRVVPKNFIAQASMNLNQLIETLQYKGGQDVVSTINGLIPEIKLTHEYILKKILDIHAKSLLFGQILDIVKPKVAFFTCFYTDINFGLMLACSKRGIISVDIAHGGRVNCNGLYSDWTNIPENGYELLPDIFWVWGEEYKKNLISHPCHQAIAGGNPWVTKWLEHKNFPLNSDDECFVAKSAAAEKVILFSAQPLPDPFPSHVLKAITQSPKNWLWLIRLHPRQRAETNSLEKQVREQRITNVEVAYPSNAPLCHLLDHSDWHITISSSVESEAHAFGVPTIFVTEEGAKLYTELIAQGSALAAFTAEDLLDKLNRPIEPIINSREGMRTVSNAKTLKEAVADLHALGCKKQNNLMI